MIAFAEIIGWLLKLSILYILFRATKWLINYSILFNNINKLSGPKAKFILGNVLEFGKRNGNFN
jgi:hypothetical protein